MEEHITTMAGAEGGTSQTVEDLQAAIREIDARAETLGERNYHQRNTLYELI
jgi:5-amino-6-(D-ribitylamino)uracil---L-tyrosine 4-hydroxyphenyl transferase